MSFQHKKFEILTPEVLKPILKDVWMLGYLPTLIGGLVRDFLLEEKVGKDWDFELVHPTIAFNRGHWKELGQKLAAHGKVTYLPFEIIKLEVRDQHFEFSPPRREIFLSDWEKHGHKNFTAEFDFRLTLSEAFSRRDFTINSIGIHFAKDGEISLRDPLSGVEDLRKKILRPSGINFSKDPVRFLRAYRFKTKLDFEFSVELTQALKEMPVDQVSAFYVWEEMQKSKKPLSFLKLITESERLNLPLNKHHLPRWAELEGTLIRADLHESWVTSLELMGIDSEPWQKFFNVGSESMRRLARWGRSTVEFLKLKPEMFQGEFDEMKAKPEFDHLFDWYFTTKQLLQKDPSLPLMKLIEERLPDWIHLYRFEPVKDVRHIEPPLRARYLLWNLCQRL